MVDYGMFFDSRSGDRAYDAEAFREWVRKFFKNGIAKDRDGSYGLTVSSAGGRQVSVSPGAVFINGAILVVKEPVAVDIPDYAQTVTCNIVAEYNANRDTRDIVIKAVPPAQYGGSSDPVRDDFVHQLVLARVSCGSGASVLPSGVTDTRANDSLCGFMVCEVDEVTQRDFLAAVSAYLDEIETDGGLKYEGLRADLTDKLDYTDYAVLEAMQESLKRGKSLIDDTNGLQSEIDAADRYVDNQISRSEVLFSKPSSVNLGTALSSIKFSGNEIDGLKAVVLTFYYNSRYCSIILRPERYSSPGYGIMLDGWMGGVIYETNYKSKSGSSTVTWTHTNNREITDFYVSIDIPTSSGSGTYTPSSVTTEIHRITSRTTWTYSYNSSSFWSEQTVTRNTPTSTSDVSVLTGFSVSYLTITALY